MLIIDFVDFFTYIAPAAPIPARLPTIIKPGTATPEAKPEISPESLPHKTPAPKLVIPVLILAATLFNVPCLSSTKSYTFNDSWQFLL